LTLPRIRLGFAYQGKTLSGWYGSGDELFERWWDLGSEPMKGLRQAGEEFRPDLIHSHNLPDSLTAIALELFAGRVPVIHVECRYAFWGKRLAKSVTRMA
jgi:hypothetical protein